MFPPTVRTVSEFDVRFRREPVRVALYTAFVNTTTTAYTVTALSPEIAAEARRTMTDSRGHRLHVRHDAERHQCRVCLQLTEPGEGYVALSYSPFPVSQPYAESGPIFIHERACTPYADRETYPPEFPRKDVVLRAYGTNDEIVDAAYVGNRGPEEALADLFANPEVAYVHARNSTYGCFMFRVDRGGNNRS